MKTIEEKLKEIRELIEKNPSLKWTEEEKRESLKEINRVSAMPKHQKALINYLKEIGQIKN